MNKTYYFDLYMDMLSKDPTYNYEQFVRDYLENINLSDKLNFYRSLWYYKISIAVNYANNDNVIPEIADELLAISEDVRYAIYPYDIDCSGCEYELDHTFITLFGVLCSHNEAQLLNTFSSFIKDILDEIIDLTDAGFLVSKHSNMETIINYGFIEHINRSCTVYAEYNIYLSRLASLLFKLWTIQYFDLAQGISVEL